MRPPHGRTAPIMVRRVVVLPAPLAPMMVVSLPGADLERNAPEHLDLAVTGFKLLDFDRRAHQFGSMSFSAMFGSPR